MIRQLYISPGHNYFGHHGKPPSDNPILPVDQIECVAGRGVRGDRFFDHKPDYKGQITFFAAEVLTALWDSFDIPPAERDFSATRRNVIVEGLDLDACIGQEFELQGLRFFGTEECRPCYWMDTAFRRPDIEAWLRGQGGLRAKILTDGTLKREEFTGQKN